MKTELITITEEMTGSTKLAEVLNENFEALNETAHKREMAIFNRFNELNTKIDGVENNIEKRIDQMEERIIRTISEAITANNTILKKEVFVILRQAGIDPNLLTEED